MAVYFECKYTAGQTLFATVKRLSDGYRWSVAGAAFEAAPTLANSKITLTEGSSEYAGTYAGSVASMGSPGDVTVYFHDDALAGDVPFASVNTYVRGSNEVSSSYATEIADGAVDADAIASDAITAAKIAAGSIDAATFAGDVDAEARGWLGLASANLDTQLADLPTNAELATALASADDATLAAIAALNNLSSAQVQTAAAAALTAYDPPTNAEMEARTLVAANYATAAALDTVDNFLDTEVAAIKAVTDKLDTAMELDGAVYRFTTNSLEQAPSGGSLTAEDVWALADGIETGFTPRRVMRILAAAVAGKSSGGPDSPIMRNVGDTQNQITGTADSDGNRTAASYGT